MPENGLIPNPDDCLLYDAPWAYFMSWSDLINVQNTDQHIIDVFNKKNVPTLENPASVKDNLSDIKSKYRLYPNPSN